MAQGDTFAGWLKDVVNSVPILGAYSTAAWGPGNYNPNPDPNAKGLFSPDATAMERIGSAINAIPFAKVTGDAFNFGGEHFAPLKFALDFGNRTADSLFTAGQANDDNNPDTSFLDGWRQGWDSWGSAEHLTAGQIIGASLNNGLQPTGISPFTPQGIKQTQELARTTWYGDVAGAVSDVAAGFLGVPAGAIGKAGRTASTINSLAQAEKVTEVLNAGKAAGKGLSPLGLSAANHASRLETLAKDTLSHADNMVDAMNAIGPKTTNMSGRGARVLAEIAVEAKKLDPVMGEHVMANTYLAAMGSDAARAELMSTQPLLAAKLANGSLAPQVFDATSKGAELLIDAYKKDPSSVRMDQIISQVFDTPRKQAEVDSLQKALDAAKQDAVKAKDLRGRLAALRPRNRMMVNGQGFDLNADNLTIKEARIKAEGQFNDLRGQVDEAKAELAAAKKAGDQQALGAAQQKHADLTQRLGEARADFNLLKSTPLDENGYTLPQWRQDMANAKQGSKIAARKADILTALTRTAKRELATDAKTAREISPTLNATHSWLADIDALGRGENVLPTLRTTPSKLDQAKTWFRDNVGSSYMYDSGDFSERTFFHTFPKNWVAAIGTPHARSAINVLDRYTGMQELGTSLRKSRAYSGDEIRLITEEFLSKQPGEVAQFVDQIHNDMLDRIVSREAPDLSPEDVKKAIGGLSSGMHQSRAYMATQLKQAEDAGSDWASMREFPEPDASHATHNVPVAVLRSHLADTVPFADPVNLSQALKQFQTKGSVFAATSDMAIGGLDMALAGWKLAALIRPGLMVRNMLDSNVRAYAIMGTVPTMMSAVNGTMRFLRNNKIRVGDWTTVHKAKVPMLEAIGAQNPKGLVRSLASTTDVPIGKGKSATVSLYDQLDSGEISAASLAQVRQAMTKGTNPSEGLLAWSNRNAARFLENNQVWDAYKADSHEWPKAYAQHAQVLLASPTARKLMEMDAQDAIPGQLSGNFVSDLFKDPAVRDEYRLLEQTHNMTPEMFVEQVLRETEMMFPEPGMAQDLLAGRFMGPAGKQWIESHFPPDQRFNVPGNESIFEYSAAHRNRAPHAFREAVNKTFNALQDAPDFWLARHPVGVNAFKRQVKVEAQRLLDARVAKYGPDAEITPQDLAKIQQRARNHAVGVVRDYMYDATRHTAVDASAGLHRLIPFFAPFADTMRAYSRLLYDDPSRLGRIAGLYNVPFNANTWAADPFIVDEYGNRVHRGQEPQGGAFFVLGGNWGDVNGQRVLKDSLVKLRASSFNTILQGDVPWLPGWGPAVQIPVNVALNNDKELALTLSQSDNPGVQTLMKSLFPDGEVPVTDESTLWKTLAPSWLRRFADARDGVTYGRNVAYLWNSKYIEAMNSGQPFDYQKALKESQAEATAAAWPLLVAQFGFGISGDANVLGKFYVDKMHEFQALATPPPGGGPSPLEVLYGQGVTPTAVFAQQFPEASQLSWSFTRNETGIQATVTAQKSALANRDLIDKNPEYGWFIVGADNVGGDFSYTAYNQQKSDSYGVAGLGRRQLDNGEIAKKAEISMGWDHFQRATMALSSYAAKYQMNPDVVERARQALIADLGQKNPDWYSEYNNRLNRTQDFYQRADMLAKDPAMANRQDIAMYVTYRKAMGEVLGALGLKSLAGTSANSAKARWVLNKIGQDMASQNIGFQQMWERVLYNDVKPKPTDGKFGNAAIPASSGDAATLTNAG